MENHSSKNKPVDLLAMLKDCLTVGGYNLAICRVRENSTKIRHMEKPSRVNKLNGFEILKELMNLPIKTCKEAE